MPGPEGLGCYPVHWMCRPCVHQLSLESSWVCTPSTGLEVGRAQGALSSYEPKRLAEILNPDAW